MNRATARHPSKPGQTRMRIGDVAARAGVNKQTLRYYERRGILVEPKRSRSGYREYPDDTVRLIRFIKRAQELGFTLAEIEELVMLRRTNRKQRSKVRELAAAKMRDIDQKLERLQAMRSALGVLVEDCTCGAETLTCPILEALDDGVAPGARDETR